MYEIITVNGEWLPKPKSDLVYTPEKVQTEYDTEAGTTVVQVIRPVKLTITGSWTLTGSWMRRFRAFRDADTVRVGVYYPDPSSITEYECQFQIKKETHVSAARWQIPDREGLYEVDVTLEAL